MKQLLALVVCLAVGGMLVANETAARPAFESIATEHLPNAHRVTSNLVSGAQPEGEQGFQDLKALGIKTIVSVDGAKPDVETAKKYGLRYVHLPITYSGVTGDEGRRIGKALSELDGPIYLHCHHGKHRSAAAVAVACVMNGTLKPEQAESVLQTFGTGENYFGLWKAAREAKPLDPKELARVKVDYVETARIPALAERMVKVDETWDNLKAVEKNGWRVPSDHPDLDPAHEALQLQEHFREAARTDEVAKRPAAFRAKLTDAEAAAAALREALAAKSVDPKTASAAFKTLGTSCATCHKAYRD